MRYLPDIDKDCVYKYMVLKGCSFDCAYCSFPSLNSEIPDLKKTAIRILEVVRRNRYRGIFLTSAMGKDPEIAMESIIEIARYIRKLYDGYLHIKVLPGASRDQVKNAVLLGDRVSVNLEAPDRVRLSELSSSKDFVVDILRRQRWIREEIRKINDKKHVTQTTQLVVGAGDETDQEIVRSAFHSYKEMGMARVYYSRFIPLKNSKLEHKKPEARERVRRLYQLDALIRIYGYSEKEIGSLFNEEGNLTREDPKITLAKKVDINRAEFDELIKVPGIGLKGAERILNVRKNKTLNLKDLRKLGVNIKKAQPFVSAQTTLGDFDFKP